MATAGADDPIGSLLIELTGMHSDEGAAVYAVWSGPQGWLDNGSIRSGSVPVAGGVAAVTLTGLPHGEYAVSVFHDVNGNGKLDTGLFGLPKEPIGTSNNARVRFGPPRYDDAVIVLDRPDLTITIGIRKIF